MDIVVKGIKTNYIKKGSGENVVLLHGWGSSMAVFSQTAELLAENHTVYALDMPGCGLTEEPSVPLDAAGYVDFVLEFVRKMGIKKASFIGHSNGGRVIIKMASSDVLPIEIDKLVLIDSAGIKRKKNVWQKIKVMYFKLGKAILSTAAVKKLFPSALDSLKNKHGSKDYRNASPMMKECMVRLINEDLTDSLKNIKYPTLLIWGDRDTATPLSDGQKMEKLIPDAGLVVLKNTGHFSFLEQSFVYLNVISSFMNR